jgi:protein-L-isoaspartate(D-aspartate) O-methyltransferase
VVGEAPVMEARIITCAGAGSYGTVSLFETCIPALRNAPQRTRFTF